MADVYVDAGHIEDTWEDTDGKGVIRNGKGYEEHHFNIAVAERAVELLRQNGVDARVTKRSYAETESLRARTDEANDHNAKLLVSVHANAGVKRAEGACIFYWPSSKRFANIWTDNWKDADMGVGLHGDGDHAVILGTWTNMHIVREAVMPSYIIEHGFMTNDHDFKYIFGRNKKNYREKAAQVLARSGCEYLGKPFKMEGELTVSQYNDIMKEIKKINNRIDNVRKWQRNKAEEPDVNKKIDKVHNAIDDKLDTPPMNDKPWPSHETNVEWAEQMDISNGKDPHMYISREQTMSMLKGLYDAIYIEGDTAGASHIDAWQWAIDHGITNGGDPHHPITREQVVTMLKRYDELNEEVVSSDKPTGSIKVDTDGTMKLYHEPNKPE